MTAHGNDPQRILIADDEPSVRDLLTRWLERAGYAVETAEDGEKACERADAATPDIVLLDLLLPRRDGYSVLFHLRSREATKKTPVIFISGEPQQSHDEIARTLGAQGFISKPFDLAHVAALVERLIGPARAVGG